LADTIKDEDAAAKAVFCFLFIDGLLKFHGSLKQKVYSILNSHMIFSNTVWGRNICFNQKIITTTSTSQENYYICEKF